MSLFSRYRNHADDFNRYFNVAKNIGLIISGVYGLLTKIIENEEINEFVLETLKVSEGFINKLVSYRSVVIVFFIALISWSFIRFIYKAIKSSINNKKNIAEFAKKVHLDFIHKIRSNIVEIDDLSERLNKAVNEDGNIDSIYNEEFNKLKNNIQPYVDELGEYLSKYRNQKISVCIKSFYNGKRYKKDYLKEELITIARSANTKKSRTTQHRSVVGENTDFIDLCCGKSMFFGKTNLKELSDNGLYKNDSPEWWKKYNSTLVAPIRYYDKDSNKGNMNIDIDIIGFLCIDCKANIKQWENSNSFELQLLAIVADSLYTYIRIFYNCFESIGYFNKEND